MEVLILLLFLFFLSRPANGDGHDQIDVVRAVVVRRADVRICFDGFERLSRVDVQLK